MCSQVDLIIGFQLRHLLNKFFVYGAACQLVNSQTRGCVIRLLLFLNTTRQTSLPDWSTCRLIGKWDYILTGTHWAASQTSLNTMAFEIGLNIEPNTGICPLKLIWYPHCTGNSNSRHMSLPNCTSKNAHPHHSVFWPALPTLYSNVCLSLLFYLWLESHEWCYFCNVTDEIHGIQT